MKSKIENPEEKKSNSRLTAEISLYMLFQRMDQTRFCYYICHLEDCYYVQMCAICWAWGATVGLPLFLPCSAANRSR